MGFGIVSMAVLFVPMAGLTAFTTGRATPVISQPGRKGGGLVYWFADPARGRTGGKGKNMPIVYQEDGFTSKIEASFEGPPYVGIVFFR